LLSVDLEETLSQLIQERRQTERLASMGLSPTRSAIFVGPPGVGKTLTARWLASQLGVPLYVLDLTAVMSSLLGRSGTNLRAALDFAKRSPCVLLLDEIDAIAKRRSDDTDVGELKRLVTVILQEVDEWPATGLLLAATNHSELIDPALWRRFDLVIRSKRRKCRLSRRRSSASSGRTTRCSVAGSTS
jgi:SpoVK/Ycf46/Vps4 family AAA+-type ATPase